jgi:hypothetical protein
MSMSAGFRVFCVIDLWIFNFVKYIAIITSDFFNDIFKQIKVHIKPYILISNKELNQIAFSFDFPFIC